MASHSTNHPFRALGVPQKLRTRKLNSLGARYAGLQTAGASSAPIPIHDYGRANPGCYDVQTVRYPAASLPYGSLAETKS